MDKWLHKTLTLSGALQEQEILLRHYGEDGWELASVSNGIAYLKKALVPGQVSVYEVPRETRSEIAPNETSSMTPKTLNEEWTKARKNRFTELQDLLSEAPSVGWRLLQAMTTQDTGVKSGLHSHIVKVRYDGAEILGGMTDVVNNHFHEVKKLCFVAEVDGHTHTFEPDLGNRREGTVSFES